MSDRSPGYRAAVPAPRSSQGADPSAAGASVPRASASQARATASAAADDVLLSAIRVPRRLMGAAGALAFFNHPGGYREVHAFDVPSSGRAKLRCFFDRHRTELEQVAAGDSLLAIDEGQGFVLLAPLRGHQPGHLLAVWFERRSSPLSEAEELLIEVLVSQLSADLSRETRDEARISAAVAAERERISRDLHDVVVQRIFAAGLHLKGLVARPELAAGRETIAEVISQLDLSIGDLRSSIFELTNGRSADPAVNVGRVVREYAGFFTGEPDLTCTGDLTHLEPVICDHLLATLRELLSNASRHAGATQLWVAVTVQGQQLELVVSDDGRGVPSGVPHSGLENLRTRALLLGGSFEVADRAPRGTTVTWRVPAQHPVGRRA